MTDQNKYLFFFLAFAVLGSSAYFLIPKSENSSTSFSSEQGETFSAKEREAMQKQIRTFRADDAKCDELYKKGKGLGYRFERGTEDLMKDKTVAGSLISQDFSGNTKFQILDNGLASLWKRLDLIKNAKKSIDIEYFIYRIRENKSLEPVTSVKSFFSREKFKYFNKSTIIITHEIIKKALEGVKVRVLLDASGTVWTFKEDMYLASHLLLKEMAEKRGIDYNSVKSNLVFKMYNKSPILKLSTLNFRNHRKLLLVDGLYAMTGGRNIEDKYFDLDPYYNFHDRDVLVTHQEGGEAKSKGLVLAMQKSFDGYWTEKKTSRELWFSKFHDSNKYIKNKMKTFKFSWFQNLMNKRDIPMELSVSEDDSGQLTLGDNVRATFEPARVALDILRVEKHALLEKIELINNKYFGKKRKKQFRKEHDQMMKLKEQLDHTQASIDKVGKANYDKTIQRSCKKATFVSDRSVPKGIIRLRLDSFFHGNKYKENFRFTGRLLEEKLLSSLERHKKSSNKDKEFNILVGSPYLSLNCRTNKLADRLLEENAKFSIFTNSLVSTDAIYNASLFYKRADFFTEAGAELFAHNGENYFSKEEQYPEVFDKDGKKKDVRKARWGLHSKSHVFGEDTIYIGTYNMDNRSSFYNAEMGVFCEDTPELAKELRDNMEARIDNASIYVKNVAQKSGINRLDNKAVDPHGNVSDPREIEFMYKIFPIIEKIEFLF